MSNKTISNVGDGSVTIVSLSPDDLAKIAAQKVNLKPRARQFVLNLARAKRSELFNKNWEDVFEFLLDTSLGDLPRAAARVKSVIVRDTLKAIIAEAIRLIGLINAVPDDALDLRAQLIGILSDQQWP